MTANPAMQAAINLKAADRTAIYHPICTNRHSEQPGEHSPRPEFVKRLVDLQKTSR
jgi:hypothetical protein